MKYTKCCTFNSRAELKKKKSWGKIHSMQRSIWLVWTPQGRGSDLLWVPVLQWHYKCGTVTPLPSAQQYHKLGLQRKTPNTQTRTYCGFILYQYIQNKALNEAQEVVLYMLNWMQINNRLFFFWLQMYNKYKNIHLFVRYYLDDDY